MKHGEYILSTEKVGRAFWKLALPALITTLISQIYNLTDTYFIGLLRDTQMLSAVSLAMPIMWLVGTLCGLLGTGAPQVISLRLGAKDGAAAAKCRSFAVLGTIAVSLIVSPIAFVLIRPALGLMGAEGLLLQYAAEYLEVIIATGIFSATAGAMQGVLRADGRTKQASIAGMTGIAVNIVLDPIFILGLGLGMRGAAIATALGSVAALIVSSIYTRKDISLRNALPAAKDIAAMLKLSLASSISSVIQSLTVACSFTLAVGFGGNMMATISVASKIYALVVTVVSALAFSMQPFIGYNHAAGDLGRLYLGLRLSICVGFMVCMAGFAAFMLAGGPLMSLFTGDAALISSGATMLRHMAIGLPVAAVLMNAMSYLSATGKAMQTMTLNLCKQLVIFVPALLILQHFMGEMGLMLAYPVTDILSTIPAVMFCVKDMKTLFSADRNT